VRFDEVAHWPVKLAVNSQLQCARDVISDYALQKIGTASQPITPHGNVQLIITQCCSSMCITLFCDQNCGQNPHIHNIQHSS